MNKYYDTSTLSISSKYLSKCTEVAKTLMNLGVTCRVSSNQSIVEKNGILTMEKGCAILLPEVNPTDIPIKVWQPLKNKYHLDCAHLSVTGKFQGCIYDFMQNTACPGSDE